MVRDPLNGPQLLYLNCPRYTTLNLINTLNTSTSHIQAKNIVFFEGLVGEAPNYISVYIYKGIYVHTTQIAGFKEPKGKEEDQN